MNCGKVISGTRFDIPTKYEVRFNGQKIFEGGFRLGTRQNDTEIYSTFESAANNTIIHDLVYSGEWNEKYDLQTVC